MGRDNPFLLLQKTECISVVVDEQVRVRMRASIVMEGVLVPE
jgi:hypothetical protein